MANNQNENKTFYQQRNTVPTFLLLFIEITSLLLHLSVPPISQTKIMADFEFPKASPLLRVGGLSSETSVRVRIPRTQETLLLNFLHVEN